MPPKTEFTPSPAFRFLEKNFIPEIVSIRQNGGDPIETDWRHTLPELIEGHNQTNPEENRIDLDSLLSELKDRIHVQYDPQGQSPISLAWAYFITESVVLNQDLKNIPWLLYL